MTSPGERANRLRADTLSIDVGSRIAAEIGDAVAAALRVRTAWRYETVGSSMTMSAKG